MKSNGYRSSSSVSCKRTPGIRNILRKLKFFPSNLFFANVFKLLSGLQEEVCARILQRHVSIGIVTSKAFPLNFKALVDIETCCDAYVDT